MAKGTLVSTCHVDWTVPSLYVLFYQYSAARLLELLRDKLYDLRGSLVDIR